MNKRQKSYALGLRAEIFSAFYLMLRGYRILKLRYKTPVGEIDILACKKNTLVAVEVKARKNQSEALAAVDARSQKRIEKALMHYVMHHPTYAGFDMRFDVIALYLGVPFSFQHLDNAWQARS